VYCEIKEEVAIFDLNQQASFLSGKIMVSVNRFVLMSQISLKLMKIREKLVKPINIFYYIVN